MNPKSKGTLLNLKKIFCPPVLNNIVISIRHLKIKLDGYGWNCSAHRLAGLGYISFAVNKEAPNWLLRLTEIAAKYPLNHIVMFLKKMNDTILNVYIERQDSCGRKAFNKKSV